MLLFSTSWQWFALLPLFFWRVGFLIGNSFFKTSFYVENAIKASHSQKQSSHEIAPIPANVDNVQKFKWFQVISPHVKDDNDSAGTITLMSIFSESASIVNIAENCKTLQQCSRSLIVCEFPSRAHWGSSFRKREENSATRLGAIFNHTVGRHKAFGVVVVGYE